jgi:glutaconate CoA-transferase subunit B
VLGPRPNRLPLSVADPELAETAQTIVGVPEIFAYWLSPGRIDLGLLGAAQVDRFGNVNSTVIGPYESPRVRLPGAGGAPEIASACRETIILLRHDSRALVREVDFVTTVGHGSGPGDRESLGLAGRGPIAVFTDLGVLEPDPSTLELALTRIHPGVRIDQAREATGWDLAVAQELVVTPEPTSDELAVLRRLDRAG